MIDVTVAICTWNRASLLDQTLQEFYKLNVPSNINWELIVVNNNSTDHTDHVLKRHSMSLPLKILHEPKPGHSCARNAALRVAQGDLLLWTDDDVLVDPNWLSAYLDAAQRWPTASFFGGTIDPWFEVEPPAWLSRHWAIAKQAYVVRQYDEVVRPLAPSESPAGANMAFRTSVLRKYPFNERLGRFADELSGADDDDVIQRLRDAGELGIWVGSARVRHFLPRNRLTRDYLSRWFYGAGITQVRKNGLKVTPLLFGMPRWALRQYLQAKLKTFLLEPFRTEAWFLAFRQACILKGFLHESQRVTAITPLKCQ